MEDPKSINCLTNANDCLSDSQTPYISSDTTWTENNCVESNIQTPNVKETDNMNRTA